MSSYLHVVRSPPTVSIHKWWAQEWTYSEYATSGISEELDNWQTRCVAGPPHQPSGIALRTLLERAVRNIDEHFTLSA